MKYNTNIMYRHRLLHEEESREQHLLFNLLYLPLHFEAAAAEDINIIL